MSLTPSLVGITSSSATQLVVVQPGQSVTLCSTAVFTVGVASGVTVGAAASFAVPASTPVTWTLPNDLGAVPVALYGIAGSSINVSVMVTGNP
jgi:hypothetical protein